MKHFKQLMLALVVGTQALTAMAMTQVEMQTSAGTIRLELDEKSAPKTVANFVSYARDGFYNGTLFHRVIDGFMIQGGGFEAGMKHKATRAPIENEASNGLKNSTGSIAMARTSDPHSATSQFFINLNDNPSLDYRPGNAGYTVFGRVTQGMDVVQRIAKVSTGTTGMYQDVPLTPVIIQNVKITSNP